MTQEKKEGKLRKLLKEAKATIDALKKELTAVKAELKAVKAELFELKSVRNKLKQTPAEKENVELRSMLRWHQSVIDKYNLGHLFQRERVQQRNT